MKRCRALGLLALLVIWIGLPLGVLAEDSSTVIGEDYVLAPGEVVSTDLVVVGGTATLMEASLVAGDVAVMGGELIVDGEVHGDIVAFAGSLYLQEHADVSGDIISFGRLERHPDARVSGNLVEGTEVGGGLARFADILQDRPELELLGQQPGERRASSVAASILGAIIKLVVLAGLAILVAQLMPQRMGNVQAVMLSSAPLSIGVGLLTLVVSTLLVPLLIVICIGIPVAIALVLALIILGLVGWLAAGAIVGEQLVKLTDARVSPTSLVVAGGTMLITLISYVPCLGALLVFLVVAWASGAIVLSRLGSTVDTTWAPLPHQHQERASAPVASSGAGTSDTRDTHKLN